MGLRIPAVGSIIHRTFAVDTRTLIADGVKDALEDAGWTIEEKEAKAIFNMTGTPGDGDTVTINGLVYTWKTVINNANPREVLIGGSASACAANLADAIINGGGSGTLFSSATTAHPDVTATSGADSVSGYNVNITSLTTGLSSTFTVSEVSGNASFHGGSGNSWGEGYKCTSAPTPDGRSMIVYIEFIQNTSDSVRFRVTTVDGLVESFPDLWDHATAASAYADPYGYVRLVAVGGRILSIRATAHDFYTYMAGDAGVTLATVVAASCMYVPDSAQPVAIEGATNATPIVITATAHGRATGAIVNISDVLGNTAANGQWTITVISANTFSLDGSVGNGAWTSSTGVVALDDTKISRCIFFNGDNRTGDGAVVANVRSGGTSWAWDGRGTGCIIINEYKNFLSVPIRYIYGLGGDGLSYPVKGGNFNLQEARVAFPYASSASQIYETGEFWAACIINDPGILLDQVKELPGFGGHDWKQYSKDAKAGLWLAIN